MGEILKKLVIQLGIDGKELDKGIKESKANLESLASTAKRLIGGYLSYQALSGAIQSYQDFNLQIANAQALMGGSASDLSAMARAMRRFGGDTASVVGAMKSMNSHLQAAKFGGGALIEVARKYGISVSAYQSADKAILSLARQMQGYNRQTKLAIMSQLGLDESMQRAFMDGGKELERYIAKQKAIGVETEDDIKLSQQFNNAILDMKDMFSALTREMLRGIMPIIQGFVDFLYKFIEALRKNKPFAYAFFAGLAVLLSPLLLMFIKMAAASIAAFAPFYAIGAAIVFVVGLIEDLYYYFMGWNSATGELAKKFPIIHKVLAPLKPLVMGIVDFVKKIINFIKDPSWQGFKDIFSSLKDTAINAVEGILGGFGKLFDFLGEKFPALAPLFDGLKSMLGNVWELVKGLVGAAKDFFAALFNWNIDGMVAAVQKAIDTVLGSFKKAWGTIKDTLGGLWDSLFGSSDTPQAPAQAPAQPVAVAQPANININNNLQNNITTNASAGQIQNATQNALTSSISAQRQAIGGVY